MMTKYMSNPVNRNKSIDADIVLRTPTAGDGVSLHRLVGECPPLDPNSLYCNLLQCTHFAATSVVAESRGRIVGAISGYVLPDDERTLFIWQVAVSPEARNQGLAMRMLREILARPWCRSVHRLHTTVTPDNQASRTLFTALARDLEAPFREHVWFESQRHFGGLHADEVLLQIGPFSRPSVLAAPSE